MFKNSKNFMPTYILVAVNIAVYGFTSYLSGNALEMSDRVLLQFGQYNPYVFNGEVWRLFTGMFVHANIAHIVGNMLFLFIYGLRAEDMFDIKEYLLIYLMSGLAGGLLTLFLWPDSLSIGASGAIFGMIGASTVYLRRAVGQSIITAVMFVFFLFAFNFGPNVNYLAHLGGLAVGLLIGYVLAATRKPRQQASYKFKYTSSYEGQ
jgi:rhomboid protease GluP